VVRYRVSAVSSRKALVQQAKRPDEIVTMGSLRMEIPKIASKSVEESPAMQKRPFTMRECGRFELASDASLRTLFDL
jgi:hypothetical protein